MLQEQEPLASSSDQDIGGSESPALRLSPIVENKEPRGTVTGLVRPVHRHALDHCPEAARQHLPIGSLAPEIDAGQDIRHAGFTRVPGAGIEQRAEPVFGPRARPYRAEFDETTAFAGFA